MAQTLHAPMSVDEFFRWQEQQDERYELVDGVPVLHRMMTGASNTHDTVVINIIGHLWNQLRGTRCRPTTADTAVRTSITGLRRPDVTVECSPPERDSYEARAPKLVIEVLSPSTRQIDQVRKVEEYKRLPTLVSILLVEPNLPHALLLSRGARGGWQDTVLTGLDAVVPLPEIGATLALRDVYEGVPLDEAS